MTIKLVGSVIFVKDIQASCRFYTEVLGQKIEFDFGPNVGFVGGLSLWDREHAAQVIFQRVAEEPKPHHHDAMLYFESDQLDEMSERVKDAGVEMIQPLAEQPWGSLSLRFYDLDGHIVEVAEPMSTTVERMLAKGMTQEAAAQKTGLPMDAIRQIAAAI